MKIGVVDYGAGNNASVLKALTAVGADAALVRHPADLAGFNGLVIPGVGHFRVTSALDHVWRRALRDRLDAQVPVLGICLGMQWLFEGSDEAPELDGLGVFSGRCFRLDGPLKVPHVGWNTLTSAQAESALLAGIPSEAWAYFTHSYAAPVCADSVATTSYGRTFSSCVERGVALGVQWHPEKSGDTGLRVLRNFMAFVRTSGIGVPASDGERGSRGTQSPGDD